MDLFISFIIIIILFRCLISNIWHIFGLGFVIAFVSLTLGFFSRGVFFFLHTLFPLLRLRRIRVTLEKGGKGWLSSSVLDTVTLGFPKQNGINWH